MKKLIGEWKRGVGFFFQEELISFYTFFTVIFAECAYLWAFHEETWAFCLTVMLLGYVFNVIVCAWLKGVSEGTKLEAAFTFYYSFAFVMMFAAGCLFNAKMTIILTAIPFGITALWIGIREFQVCAFYGFSKPVMLIKKVFNNKIFNVCMHILIVGVPLGAFAICFAQIPKLDVVWKIIIPIVYAFCIPLFALYEDSSAGLNIFELAYEIS